MVTAVTILARAGQLNGSGADDGDGVRVGRQPDPTALQDIGNGGRQRFWRYAGVRRSRPLR